MSYVISVVFKDRGDYWSKPYTYKSDTKYDIGAVVLVPMRDFYSVGKVIGYMSESEYNFKPGIEYKSVLKKVI
jgi:hypothetical protein